MTKNNKFLVVAGTILILPFFTYGVISAFGDVKNDVRLADAPTVVIDEKPKTEIVVTPKSDSSGQASVKSTSGVDDFVQKQYIKSSIDEIRTSTKLEKTAQEESEMKRIDAEIRTSNTDISNLKKCLPLVYKNYVQMYQNPNTVGIANTAEFSVQGCPINEQLRGGDRISVYQSTYTEYSNKNASLVKEKAQIISDYNLRIKNTLESLYKKYCSTTPSSYKDYCLSLF